MCSSAGQALYETQVQGAWFQTIRAWPVADFFFKPEEKRRRKQQSILLSSFPFSLSFSGSHTSFLPFLFFLFFLFFHPFPAPDTNTEGGLQLQLLPHPFSATIALPAHRAYVSPLPLPGCDLCAFRVSLHRKKYVEKDCSASFLLSTPLVEYERNTVASNNALCVSVCVEKGPSSHRIGILLVALSLKHTYPQCLHWARRSRRAAISVARTVAFRGCPMR